MGAGRDGISAAGRPGPEPGTGRQGAAAHERETLEAVTQARAPGRQVNIGDARARPRGPQALPGGPGPAVVGALAG